MRSRSRGALGDAAPPSTPRSSAADLAEEQTAHLERLRSLGPPTAEVPLIGWENHDLGGHEEARRGPGEGVPVSNLREAIQGKEIIVVCGAGGVGKTTTSAAPSRSMPRKDTQDDRRHDRPGQAPRLARSGWKPGLGHNETPRRAANGHKGSLHAAMLDMKTAWDDLIDRYSPTRAQAQHIKENRIYRGVSEQFVGSQGYMAMERLADLHERGDYDLIVIDTPPTRSALDFLEAPKRMTDFIGGSLLRWMAKPYAAAGKIGLRAFGCTASPFLRIADRVLGSQVLEDLSALVMDFQNLYEGFKERADAGPRAVVLALRRGSSS